MKRRDLLFAVLLTCVLIGLALPMLHYPLGRDQGEFATIGQGILRGKIPYVDLWNPKPPAIFYVYAGAIAIGGHSIEALRAIDLIMLLPLGVVLYWIGITLADRRMAALALVAFGYYYFSETYWHLTQNDGIAILPMTLAAACTLQADRSGQVRWAFGAGIFSAVTLWFKYPYALFVLALVIGYLQMRWWDRAHLSRAAGAFALGGLLIGGGGLVYMAALGALDDLIESARVTAGYTRAGYSLDEFLNSPIWIGTRQGYWKAWRFLWIILPVWLVLRYFVPSSRRGWHLIWWWGLAALGAALWQFKGYGYHFLPMLPPLCLIAADGVKRILLLPGRVSFFPPSLNLLPLVANALRSEGETPIPLPSQRSALGEGGRGWGKFVFTLLITIFLLSLLNHLWRPAYPFLSGQQSRQEYYDQFRLLDFAPADSLLVAEYLKARTEPGESLYIWGFRPEIYYMTELAPANRFIFNFPLIATWYPPAWQRENIDSLWVHLPPYVLVTVEDYMPWATGRAESSAVLLQEYTDLNNWLIYNYVEETRIGLILVYRRKAVPG